MKKHYKGDIAKDDVLEFAIPVTKEQKMKYIEIEFHVKHLMGEVLTVVDASFTDREQRKAVKDLVKDKFSSKLSWLYELCGYPQIQTDEATPCTCTSKHKGACLISGIA